jgi:hypothetical protein
MSEVYPEASGINKDTLVEVVEEREPVVETEEQYRLRMYLAWEAEEKARQAYEQEQYYAFIDRCREAEQAVRDRYAKNPGHTKRELHVWDRDDVDEDEKFRARLEYDLDKFRQEGNEFSPAALAVTTSLESAEFFDNMKCDYLGHSDHLGWFKEMSTRHNHSPFELQFDYDVGVLNAYTASGNILHIRETRDPEATTREQRQLILGMNVLTREVKRYYAENESVVTPSTMNPHGFDEMVTLQPRKLSVLSGGIDLDSENLFAPLYQRALDDAARQSLAKILYSSRGGLHFKPEGLTSTFETLRPIGELDRERSLFSGLARAAGMQIGDRGVVLDHRLHSRIAA